MKPEDHVPTDHSESSEFPELSTTADLIRSAFAQGLLTEFRKNKDYNF